MTGKQTHKPTGDKTATTKRAEGIGRATQEDMDSWLSAQGLHLDDANGVELQVALPMADAAAQVEALVPLADTEATAQLDAATIHRLRAAAAASRKPA